jgi:hypothetical protein
MGFLKQDKPSRFGILLGPLYLIPSDVGMNEGILTITGSGIIHNSDIIGNKEFNIATTCLQIGSTDAETYHMSSTAYVALWLRFARLRGERHTGCS